MSKSAILIISLSVIILVSLFVYLQNSKNLRYEPGNWGEGDLAVNQAIRVYNLKKEYREDFSDGPCLSNDLIPGWVADVVHNPRQPVDDLVENQCPAYREGRAKHFVELDTEGNLIRVK